MNKSSSSAISNDPDLDVTEKKSNSPLKKVKLTIKFLDYNKRYIKYGFTYLHKNNINLCQCIIIICVVWCWSMHL